MHGPWTSAAEAQGGTTMAAWPSWAGPGRKVGEGERAAGKEKGQSELGQRGKKKANRAESEEGREKRNKFLLFFQINFPNLFSS